MTRKEEIEQASKQGSIECFGYEEGDYTIPFRHGAYWADMNPMATLDEEYAWQVYNFINDWKAGKYGEIPLQKALYEHRIQQLKLVSYESKT